MIKLRQATPDDCFLELDIHEEQYKFGANPKKIKEDAIKGKNNNSSRIFVICNDELPVGMIEVCCEDELMSYNILYLFIDRRYQRKGYGYDALRQMIEMLAKDGRYDKVSVTLYDGNVAARKLYEKTGFSPNGFVFENEYDMEMQLKQK